MFLNTIERLHSSLIDFTEICAPSQFFPKFDSFLLLLLPPNFFNNLNEASSVLEPIWSCKFSLIIRKINSSWVWWFGKFCHYILCYAWIKIFKIFKNWLGFVFYYLVFCNSTSYISTRFKSWATCFRGFLKFFRFGDKLFFAMGFCIFYVNHSW